MTFLFFRNIIDDKIYFKKEGGKLMLKILNRKIKKIFKIIFCILGIIFLILLLLLIIAMFGKSFENGYIERELLVNTIATIFSGYIGIIGVLIGIWGTYLMFIVQKEDEKNNNKLYIKKELEYSLEKTALINTTLQVIYIKNYSRYYNNLEWKRKDITSKDLNGFYKNDFKVIQEIVNMIDFIEPDYLENNREKFEGDILNISDIYVYYKKLEKKFNEELLCKYTNNINLNNILTDKVIYSDIPSTPVKEWIKILNGEIKYIEISRFIYVREEIQSICDSLKV